jgi:hypothetical protein
VRFDASIAVNAGNRGTPIFGARTKRRTVAFRYKERENEETQRLTALKLSMPTPPPPNMLLPPPLPNESKAVVVCGGACVCVCVKRGNVDGRWTVETSGEARRARCNDPAIMRRVQERTYPYCFSLVSKGVEEVCDVQRALFIARVGGAASV